MAKHTIQYRFDPQVVEIDDRCLGLPDNPDIEDVKEAIRECIEADAQLNWGEFDYFDSDLERIAEDILAGYLTNSEDA